MEYLWEAARGALTHIIHLMFNRAEVDFSIGKIIKAGVHPEFIVLFRMGLKGSEWKGEQAGLH